MTVAAIADDTRYYKKTLVVKAAGLSLATLLVTLRLRDMRLPRC